MIKPLYKNVLIKLIDEETVTKQGLIIKNSQSEDVKIGEVIKTGEDVHDAYIKEKVKILFNVNDCNKIFYSNQNYILIESSKILGIIE